MDAISLKYFDISWFSSKDGPGTRTVLFLQGCHLRCPWCHSPQTWEELSPLMFFENRCLFCGACAGVCPHNVHGIDNHKHNIDRTSCKRCGTCIKKCPVSRGAKWNTGALGLAGLKIKADELFQLLKPQLELLKKIGGLTVSGGEPLLQFEALAGLLTMCQREGFHTAIETSASVPRKNIESIFPLVDRWLIGIRLTAVINDSLETIGNWEQIVDNLEFLTTQNSGKITIRTPIIPGYTDKMECIRKISELMKTFKIQSIEILPYNFLANHYYKAMEIQFPLEDIAPINKPALVRIRNYFAAQGFDAKIVA